LALNLGYIIGILKNNSGEMIIFAKFRLEETVQAMEFLNQFQIILGTKEGTVFIYDFQRMEILQKYELRISQSIADIVFLNQKQFALLLSDSSVMTIDLQQREMNQKFLTVFEDIRFERNRELPALTSAVQFLYDEDSLKLIALNSVNEHLNPKQLVKFECKNVTSLRIQNNAFYKQRIVHYTSNDGHFRVFGFDRTL